MIAKQTNSKKKNHNFFRMINSAVKESIKNYLTGKNKQQREAEKTVINSFIDAYPIYTTSSLSSDNIADKLSQNFSNCLELQKLMNDLVEIRGQSSTSFLYKSLTAKSNFLKCEKSDNSLLDFELPTLTHEETKVLSHVPDLSIDDNEKRVISLIQGKISKYIDWLNLATKIKSGFGSCWNEKIRTFVKDCLNKMHRWYKYLRGQEGTNFDIYYYDNENFRKLAYKFRDEYALDSRIVDALDSLSLHDIVELYFKTIDCCYNLNKFTQYYINTNFEQSDIKKIKNTTCQAYDKTKGEATGTFSSNILESTLRSVDECDMEELVACLNGKAKIEDSQILSRMMKNTHRWLKSIEKMYDLQCFRNLSYRHAFKGAFLDNLKKCVVWFYKRIDKKISQK